MQLYARMHAETRLNTHAGLVVTPFLPGDSLLFACGALCALGSLQVTAPRRRARRPARRWRLGRWAQTARRHCKGSSCRTARRARLDGSAIPAGRVPGAAYPSRSRGASRVPRTAAGIRPRKCMDRTSRAATPSHSTETEREREREREREGERERE